MAATEALDAFQPTGSVLELACGPGVWTGKLLRYAADVTAVDGSPEMLAVAAARAGRERVRFIQADLFTWRPDRRYDVVFIGFWLSHVPGERFESFWSLVADCLKPDGRVFLADDAYRTHDELVEGPSSSTIRRHILRGAVLRLGHDVDDPVRDDHHPADRCALGVAGVFGVAGHCLSDFFLPGTGRDLYPEAGLPVDLNRHCDHLRGGQRLVELGEWRIRQRRGVTHPGPEFVGDVRCEWGHHQDQRLGQPSRRATGCRGQLGCMGVEFHQPGDRGVEPQVLQVPPDDLDRAVQQAGGLRRRVAGRALVARRSPRR